MKNIVVIGGGGHARVVISLINKLPDYRLLGFTDIVTKKDILSAPYLGDDGVLESVLREHDQCCAALGIGNTMISNLRLERAKALVEMGFELPVLISPTSVINEDVDIGEGTVVCDSAVVMTGTRVGMACILNTDCLIDHECHVGDGVHLAPASVLCGGVKVRELAMIGAGAVVIQGLEVAERCLVGAGTTVTKDLVESGVYVGTPARKIQ
jgi:sugar O-acyltransferase (sialic acid O-acetyltransferase NeuD family)